jgi:serine/threonine-protein kinase RsbW
VQGTRLTESSGAKGSKSGEAIHSDLLVRLQMYSNPEALSLVRAALERATELLHFHETQTRAIVRSVDEALANVIRHAYQGKTGLLIEVTCNKLRVDHDGTPVTGLEILLEDSGVALDPAKLKGRALEDLRPGGLGLHFIYESMDEVEFSRKNGKNQLRMIKYIIPATPVAKPEGE